MAKTSETRLTTILWFVAASLSFLAAAVAYSRTGDIKWPLLAAGIFLAAMGFNALRRLKVGG